MTAFRIWNCTFNLIYKFCSQLRRMFKIEIVFKRVLIRKVFNQMWKDKVLTINKILTSIHCYLKDINRPLRQVRSKQCMKWSDQLKGPLSTSYLRLLLKISVERIGVNLKIADIIDSLAARK